MIDIEFIKEQYERMHDEELLRFVKNKSQHLTPEAFKVLRDELSKRNMGIDIIEQMEDDRRRAETRAMSALETSVASEFAKNIWQFVLDEKEGGASNEKLYKALLAKNIKEDYAHMMLDSVEAKACGMLKELNSAINLKWFALLVLGIVILFNYERHILFPVGAVAVSLLVSFQLASGYKQRKALQTIQKNIEAEKKNKQEVLYQ